MKKLMVVLFSAFFILFGVSVTSAEEPSEEGEAAESSEESVALPYSYETLDGTIIYFETKKDYDGFIALPESQKRDATKTVNSPITTFGSTTVKNTLISSKNVSHAWIGYHSGTPDWTKASRYTLTVGKTYSATGKYSYSDLDISISYSYTNTVSTAIPADSTRYSRLGIWGDLTLKKWKAVSRDNYTGAVVSTWYFGTSNVNARYIEPKYK